MKRLLSEVNFNILIKNGREVRFLLYYLGFTEKVINILIVNTIRWLFADFIC